MDRDDCPRFLRTRSIVPRHAGPPASRSTRTTPGARRSVQIGSGSPIAALPARAMPPLRQAAAMTSVRRSSRSTRRRRPGGRWLRLGRCQLRQGMDASRRALPCTGVARSASSTSHLLAQSAGCFRARAVRRNRFLDGHSGRSSLRGDCPWLLSARDTRLGHRLAPG